MNQPASPYQPIDRVFFDYVSAVAQQKKFLRIEFLTDLHEYYKKDAVIREVTNEGGEEYLVLASGEKLRLDRVISVGGTTSPGFPGYESTYACSL
jgi:Rho-binding antiterminator